MNGLKQNKTRTPHDPHFSLKDTHRLKVKRMGKDMSSK